MTARTAVAAAEPLEPRQPTWAAQPRTFGAASHPQTLWWTVNTAIGSDYWRTTNVAAGRTGFVVVFPGGVQ